MTPPLSESERARRKLQGFLDDKLKWHEYTHIAVTDDELEAGKRFVHTVGRARAEQPELIVTGVVDEQRAMDLISDAVAWAHAHGALTDGLRLGPDVARCALLLKDVSTEFVRTKRVAQATSRFGSDLRILQVVWPDEAGRFPGEAGYDERAHPQECLWRV